MRWQGRLERRELGTGVWVLQTAGRELQLLGDLPASAAGGWIEVEGDLAPVYGFGMVGEVVDMRSWRRVSAPESS